MRDLTTPKASAKKAERSCGGQVSQLEMRAWSEEAPNLASQSAHSLPSQRVC